MTNEELLAELRRGCSGAFLGFAQLLFIATLVQGAIDCLHRRGVREPVVCLQPTHPRLVDRPGPRSRNSAAKEALGDLAAEFTPPFHVVTVASQSASVPMQIGWILGGLLLGLGVKRAVGR